MEAGEKSIQKHGQAANPQQLAHFTLAKKLSQQLMRQVDPNSVPVATAPIGSELGEGATPALDRKNMESLGDFLQWAADNKITWDGKRVAWVLGPGEQAPPGAWKFKTYKIDRERDPYDRSAVEVPAYADKDALVKLVGYLRDSQEAKNEKVFAVMLGRLINQTNQFLEKEEQIGPRTEQKPAEVFNQNSVVDGFKDDTISMKDPYAGIQEFMKATDPNLILNRMTWADVSSKAGLIDWLRGVKFIGEDGKAYDPTAPGADPCGAIHILYLRAKYLSQYATDRLRPGFAKLEQAYFKQIQVLGPQFDNNGQPCAVTKPGTTGPEKPAQPTQPGQGGELSAATPQILQRLSSLRPFNAQYISFPEIKNFVDLYATYANNPIVTQLASNINQYIETSKIYLGTDTIQLNNITNDRFKSMLKNPSSGGAAAAQNACNLLYDTVVYAGQLYQRLVTSLQTVAQDPERGKYIEYRAMQQQVTPGGPQQTNVTDLDDLRHRLEREWMANR